MEMYRRRPGYPSKDNRFDVVEAVQFPDGLGSVLQPGDWLVKMGDGSFYPYTNSLFTEVYELVNHVDGVAESNTKGA